MVSQWKSARIDVAASFRGQRLMVRVMLMHRGGTPVIFVGTGPRDSWDWDLRRWREGGWNYDTGSVQAAVWPSPARDPWSSCSFWGPVRSAGSAAVARFCGECGAARGEGFGFCGDCGTRFSDVGGGRPDMEQEIREIAEAPERNAARLVALVETQGFAEDLTQGERAALRELLASDLREAKLTGFADGSQGPAGVKISLAEAQDVRACLAEGRPLDVSQQSAALALATHAPIQFGYWGAFKALVKAGARAHGNAAYAMAVARLAAGGPAADASGEVENLRFLAEMVTVPSQETFIYLGRRARRDLVDLAARDPQGYVAIASMMLLAWDGLLAASGRRFMDGISFAPAYVLLGADRTLDENGHRLAVPFDMSVRRDAYPRLWNAELARVREIFEATRGSVELLTWSYQVLHEAGSAPSVSADQLRLALSSTYRPLLEAGWRVLATSPEAFDSVGIDQWRRLFVDGDDATVSAVLSQLGARPVVRWAATAAQQVLESDADRVSSARLAGIAVVYFAGSPTSEYGYRWNASSTADTTGIIALAREHGLEPLTMWQPVLDCADQYVLVTAYRQLAETGAAQGALSAISATIARKTHRYSAQVIALECLGSQSRQVQALGWTLVDAHGGLDLILDDLPALLSAQASLPATATELVLEALSRANADQVMTVIAHAMQASISGMGQRELAALVVDMPGGTGLVWESLAVDESGSVLRLATSDAAALTSVGDSVASYELASARGSQVGLIRAYLETAPARVRTDRAFAVAAARILDLDVQRLAIEQLTAAGHLPEAWLELAETDLPLPREAAVQYARSLTSADQVSRTVLACMDSIVASVRELGGQLLEDHESILDAQPVWSALSESDDLAVQRLVAERALARQPIEESALADFDRRVLVARRRGRAAKEDVKRRLEAQDEAQAAADPARLETLLSLARASNPRDREWALSRLAVLAVNGVDVPGLDATLVFGGRGS